MIRSIRCCITLCVILTWFCSGAFAWVTPTSTSSYTKTNNQHRPQNGGSDHHPCCSRNHLQWRWWCWWNDRLITTRLASVAREPQQQPPSPATISIAATSVTSTDRRTLGWFPRINCDEYSTEEKDSSETQEFRKIMDNDDDATATTPSDVVSYFDQLEEQATVLVAELIRRRLQPGRSSSGSNTTVEATTSSSATTTTTEKPSDHPSQRNPTIVGLVHGRFMDLTCTDDGERVLEELFYNETELLLATISRANNNLDVIRGAIMIMQSLCAMGTQVGLMGEPEKLRRLVAHLDDRTDPSLIQRDLLKIWDRDSVRRLKYRVDRSPALSLLSKMLWKRTPQGAFELLVQLGIWSQHEDLALLRSGFPLRFTEQELAVAEKAFNSTHDPDTLLGLRKDFRGMKVYTIDGPSTQDIDDGLSVEKVTRTAPDGSPMERHRIWIHIADSDRWAPRNSSLLDIARQRITSIYLPTGPIPMFPPRVSGELMALTANRDCYALSMAVELNPDGSIDHETILVTPSLVRVTYRLTYDDVDEMLEDGVAYQEEWELGALFHEARKRRNYRIREGSTEGLVPNPIPAASVSVFPDKSSPDGIGINFSVQVAYNSGKNQTVGAEQSGSLQSSTLSCEDPSSSSYLLVTELMILAGEALGIWKLDANGRTNGSTGLRSFENKLRLAFRSQPPPDFKGRARERRMLMSLLEYNVGGGLCHAWYVRRFLQNVRVTEQQAPHAGLGLKSYVQWTSPIRRLSDLHVHACVKRYLRRDKVYKMLSEGLEIPKGVNLLDLGLPEVSPGSPMALESWRDSVLDADISFFEGAGLATASRTLQRQSQQYWIYEYIRRQREKDPYAVYDGVILGCIDPDKRQYAIYVYALGLEHRMTAQGSLLDPGVKLHLMVDKVLPRSSLLSFVRVN